MSRLMHLPVTATTTLMSTAVNLLTNMFERLGRFDHDEGTTTIGRAGRRPRRDCHLAHRARCPPGHYHERPLQHPLAVTMLGNDDGAVTVETAIATGALIAVFTTLVAGLVAVGAHLAAIDIAGAAARAYTIGVPYEPPRGAVTVTESGGLATATAVVPSPLGAQTARAVFPIEQEFGTP